MPASERLYYLDNLRALAMLAGVLFHAALAYSPLMQPYFPTADAPGSVWVDIVIWFIHLFRMPLFFVVSGYFAARLITRHGVGGLFANRLRRIAVPFLLFLPLLTAVLNWSTMRAAESVQQPSPLLLLIAQYLAMDNPPPLPPTTSHLWFLYYLLYFYILLWALRSLPMPWLESRLRRIPIALQLLLLPLLLMPALASVSAPHPAPESLLPQFWAFGYYGVFFVIGYRMDEDWLLRLRPYAMRLLLASLLLYLLFLQLLESQSPNPPESAGAILAGFEAGISIWMTLACLIGGRWLLNRSNAALRYLSAASYWSYLLHLPILFLLQYRLMDYDWHWMSKFAIASSLALLACLLSYQLLVRSTPLRRLVG